LPQDLVRLAQLTVLSLERLDPLALFGCRTRSKTLVTVRPAAPRGVVSPPSSRSSRQSSGSPPIARRARLGGPAPSEPRGHGPQGNMEELASSSLHPLKSWSLRETRCSSMPGLRPVLVKGIQAALRAA